MTDNIKKALELLKNDPDLLEKATKIKDINELINTIKEHGVNLNDEDVNFFNNAKNLINGKNKMNLNELEKVSGAGNPCDCVVGGGGKGEKYDYTCGCAVYGEGRTGGRAYCRCPLAGTGDDLGDNPTIC